MEEAIEQEFDPWEEWGLSCVSYTSKIDEDMIAVLKCIRDKKYCSDIAKELELPEEYIELLQEILCSKNICEYGTSPRGCWFKDYGKDAINPYEYIKKWEEFYKNKWNRSKD